MLTNNQWFHSILGYRIFINILEDLFKYSFILCSLRQKIQGRKSASNPTSPVTQPRRAISSPEELAVQDAIEAGFIQPRGGGAHHDAAGNHYSEVSAIATAPRAHKQRQQQNSQTAFDQARPATVCENVYSQITRRPTSATQRQDDGASSQQPPPYACSAAAAAVMHQPIAEREIPYSQYVVGTDQTQPIYGTSHRIALRSNGGYNAGTEQAPPAEHSVYATMRETHQDKTYATYSSANDGYATMRETIAEKERLVEANGRRQREPGWLRASSEKQFATSLGFEPRVVRSPAVVMFPQL